MDPLPGRHEESVSLQPLISVIVPTHNRAELMARAVASVLAQSRQNLELIVVDDASQDGTGAYLAALARTDPRVQVVRNSTPLGGAGARNRGISLSRGKWIAFLDDDDEWMATKLDRQVAVLEGDANAVACSCSYIARSASGSSRVVRVPEGITLTQLLARNCLGGASNCLCSRAILQDIGGFDPAFVSGQDLDLWVRLRMRGKVRSCAEPLAIHRAHGGARITSNLRAQYLGARHFYFKYRGLMDLRRRRQWLSFTCFMRSRQATRPLRYRVRYLLLSVFKSSPRVSLGYIKGSLPALLRDVMQQSKAQRLMHAD